MGIVFESKIGHSYKKQRLCPKANSHQAPLQALTPQNIKLLKSLGLKIRKKGKK